MLTSLFLTAALLGTTVSGQGTTCSATQKCPDSAPCCSEFGFCGDGNFCLGGCNPIASHALDSCLPNPVCKDGTYSFADTSRIQQDQHQWNGNTTQYDWVVDKGNITTADGAVAMTLTQTNGGTRLSSTRYVHYGTMTATLKTGKWGGVVTAFITMSNIRDEIDWEFPGAQTKQGQSNFFWEGVIPEKTYGDTHTVSSDTFDNYHDYTIDWQPDTLTFSIDGKAVRTVKKSDTMVNGNAQYPQTPSRIQLSLWPAGIPESPKGTVDWAGGMINWDDPDYKAAGHFYALVKQVQVKCGTADKLANDTTSYTYGANQTANEPEIKLSNATIMLGGAATTVPSGWKTGIASILSTIVGGAVLMLA